MYAVICEIALFRAVYCLETSQFPTDVEVCRGSLALSIAVGISWAHVRRRLSCQECTCVHFDPNLIPVTSSAQGRTLVSL